MTQKSSWHRKFTGLALPVALACAGVTLLPMAASAKPLACTLAGKPGSDAARGGGLVKVPGQVPDCIGVSVSKGPVVACIQDRLDMLRCKKVLAGETISAATFGSRAVGAGWGRALGDLLGGGVGEGKAMSRGGEGDLPSGPVLMIMPRFDIDFTQGGLAGMQAVEFREGSPSGPLVLRVPGVGVRSVDTARFTAGGSYSWTAVPAEGRAPLYGRFVVADAARRRQAIAHTKAVSQGSRDPQVSAVIRADDLQRQGYAFDAALVLRQGFESR